MSTVYAGVAAAPGVGMGLTAVHYAGQTTFEQGAYSGAPDAAYEWERFCSAQHQVDEELAALAERSNALVMDVFAAHRLILHDDTFVQRIHAAIRDGESAAAATYQAIGALTEIFRELDDDYFAGRSADVLDIGQRLLAHLGAATRRTRLDLLPQETILVADDLTPSEVAELQPQNVLGIALAQGAPTAHTAILARSLGIPLVCGLGSVVLRTLPRRQAIVDGDLGLLLVNPDAVQVRRYHAARQAIVEERALAARHAHEPAVTRQGIRIPVLANANSPEDVGAAADAGADGIGLLRTEYLFQGRATPPPVEEQADIYRRFVRRMGRGQLTVRALDAGGDKPVDYIAQPREDNPFLGLRGVRLLLDQPDLLRSQYRALQVAAQDAPEGLDVRFMLPMISTVAEVRAVLALLDPLHADLPRLKLGIMIEVPSAALIAARLAPLVDFFSIGTNDLAQYTLASDRTHQAVGALADPLHPSVLRLIAATCDAGRAAGVPVSLCGELAGYAPAAALLLGLGLHELSAPVPFVPLVKAAVRRCSLDECRALAARALECDDAQSVRALLA
jgi:phosphoenolpyruvate-protein phosphotransferase